MEGFADFMTLALTSIFVQNVIFTGTSDTALTLMALRKPSKLLSVSLMVSAFSVLTTMTVYPVDAYINARWLDYMPVRGALLMAAALLWYLLVGGIMRKIDGINKKVGPFIAPAALNGAVLTVPLLLGAGELPSFWGAVGMAAGSGVGFALAAWLINIGMRRMNSPDIPKWFQGAPVMLIYIGLLSMLFSAFGG